MIGGGYTPPAKDLGLSTNIYKDFYAFRALCVQRLLVHFPSHCDQIAVSRQDWRHTTPTEPKRL